MLSFTKKLYNYPWAVLIEPLALSAASPEYTASSDSDVANPSSTSVPGRSSAVSVITSFMMSGRTFLYLHLQASSAVSVITSFMMSGEPFSTCTFSTPAVSALSRLPLDQAVVSEGTSAVSCTVPMAGVCCCITALTSMILSVCWTCESPTGLPSAHLNHKHLSCPTLELLERGVSPSREHQPVSMWASMSSARLNRTRLPFSTGISTI